MKPRLLDLFSGIGGFSIGFERTGFETIGFSEIEPFPCSVLKHRWPEVPNYGDIRNIDGEELREKVDVITFGSPCQDLSVAGKRAGFKGERSGLFHEAIRVIAGTRPAFAVWENVAGALSSNSGRDFAAVIDAMADIGALDIAWRILDAQYFGVPQRRRRIFLVADFRGYRAREVLFEPESLSGDSKKSGEKREELAGTLGGGSGTRGWADDTDRMTFLPVRNTAAALTQNYGKQPDNSDTALGPNLAIAGSLSSRYSKEPNSSVDYGAFIPMGFYANAGYKEDSVSGADAPLKGGKENAGQAAIAFDTTQITSDKNYSNPREGDTDHPLASGAHAPAVAFTERSRKDGRNSESQEDLSYALTNPGSGGRTHSRQLVQGMVVRRLTPREAERLQGFQDDWTNIPGASDSARYRALGNAVAVPVGQWLAHRLINVLREERGASW